MSDAKRIIVVSDGTGRTAKRLMDAVLAQYSGYESMFRVEGVHSSVRTMRALDAIVDSSDSECLIVFSIVSRDLRKHFHMRLHEAGILHLNVLEPMLETMGKFLGFHPDYRPGLLQLVDDKYYRKVDAIGYTVEHDDGLGHQIEDADVVIVGPSRTCKTPISMYLACNHGMKVANIPVVPDVGSTKRVLLRLENVDQRRVFGVTMRPDVLAQVREERAELLGGRESSKVYLSSYHDIEHIEEEIKYFKRLCYQKTWEVINVTRRAIEEISAEILRSLEETLSYHKP
jgi:regulator of PEP synthase PpsR (kinase-PPPase family)